MDGNKCVIVGAGEFYGKIGTPSAGELVIAADGGYEYLVNIKCKIDVVIGDFDSLGEEPRHKNIIKLKTEKDDTDMLAAIRYGLDKGYKIFHIYGGTGGRISHTIANIQCVAYLSQNGAKAYLFGNGFYISAVTNGKIEFNAGKSGSISVFSHGDKAEGVYLEGFKYKLSNATLTNTFPLGVSNSFIGEKSCVRVKKGTLIVICEE